MSNSAKKIRATLLGAFMLVSPALTVAQGGTETKKDTVKTPDHLKRGMSISGNERRDNMMGDSLNVADDSSTVRAKFTENADSSGTSGEAAKKAEYAARKAELLANPVRKGDGFDAETASLYNVIALYVSGGTAGEKYTAEQYAQMLEVMFKDTAYTKNPTQIVVYYDESGEDRVTGVIVHINGHMEKRAIHPTVLVGEIGRITNEYAKKSSPGISYQPAQE